MRIPRNACFECGAPADHRHHVVPRSRGGTKTVPLCGACHGKVHDHHGLHLVTSALVKEGLAKAKAAGVQLGAPTTTDLAPESARRVLELREQGHSLRGICDLLNEQGVPGGRGGRWWPRVVRAILLRAK